MTEALTYLISVPFYASVTLLVLNIHGAVLCL